MNKSKPEKIMILSSLIKKISFLVLVFCLLTCVVISGCRKSRPRKAPASGQFSPAGAGKSAAEVSTKNLSVSKSLREIISRGSGWSPILGSFYGKELPDFKVGDITGKTQSLSDYRGKNVLVVMWATWCQPCLQEIPHLKALREIMPADKLAILAISSEPAGVIKAMAESENINYTVISYQGILPEPFSSIRGYPTIFFIKPDGTLKLVAEGMTRLGETKSIILAE
jgi:thiol-disulfide isomerase/thioredoxin